MASRDNLLVDPLPLRLSANVEAHKIMFKVSNPLNPVTC